MDVRPGFRSAAALAAALGIFPVRVCQADAADGGDGGVRARVRRLLEESGGFSNANSAGTFRVGGAGFSEYADRSVLLEFMGDVRLRVEASLPGLFPENCDAAVSLFASSPAAEGGAQEGVAYVAAPSFSAPVRRGAGFFAGARIDVENPGGGLDARAVAGRVVEALLGAAVATDAASARAPRPPRPPARWFAAGLARTFDSAARQADYDATRGAWSRARLPPVSHLAGADSPWPDADPALAAELVSWWLSFPDPAGRWAALRGRLASGEPWTADLFFATGPGPDAAAADKDWDAWLVSRRRMVLTPGVTTRAHVVRALAALDLVPGEDGVPADFADRPQPLARLFEPSARDWAPAAASAKLAELARLSAGRGDAFRAASQRLSALLARVAARRRLPPGAAAEAAAALAALAESATHGAAAGSPPGGGGRLSAPRQAPAR